MTEDEHMQKLKSKTKGNIIYNVSWWWLSGLIIFNTFNESWGVHVHTLLIIRMAIMLFYSLPWRLFFYYLANKRFINPSSVPIISAAFATPLFLWYMFMVYVFFSKNNDWKSKSFSLFLGLLLLFVESIVYILFFCFISVLLGCIAFLTLALFYIRRKEKMKNMRIGDLLLKAKGLRLKLDDLEGETECWICFNEFNQNSKIIHLPCNTHHYFHAEWIGEWVKNKNNWPLWKTEVTREILKLYKKKKPSESEMQRINNVHEAS